MIFSLTYQSFCFSNLKCLKIVKMYQILTEYIYKIWDMMYNIFRMEEHLTLFV